MLHIGQTIFNEGGNYMKSIKKNFKLTRICLLLIIMLTILSGCNDDFKESTETTLETFGIRNWLTDYSSILEEYRKFADCLINAGIESVLDNEIFTIPDVELAYNWECMLIETNIWSYRDFPKNREAFGYALKDLNENGNPELILLLKDYTVLAIFSTVDEMPKLLDAFWPKHRCAINNSGLLYTLSSGGATYWEYAKQQISQDNSQLIMIEQYGSEDGYYKIIDGIKYSISELESEELSKTYPVLSDTTANEMTKNSGIEFISLFKGIY
jgi:hypothetical protein